MSTSTATIDRPLPSEVAGVQLPAVPRQFPNRKRGNGGKPPVLNQEQHKRAIIQWMLDGKTATSYCEEHGITMGAILQWLKSDAEFEYNYRISQEARADLMFDRLDELIQEADRAENQVRINAIKLKADIMRWKISKMSRRYAEDVPQINAQVNVGLFDPEQARRMARIAYVESN